MKATYRITRHASRPTWNARELAVRDTENAGDSCESLVTLRSVRVRRMDNS
jgi:hypothetical protein